MVVAAVVVANDFRGCSPFIVKVSSGGYSRDERTTVFPTEALWGKIVLQIAIVFKSSRDREKGGRGRFFFGR